MTLLTNINIILGKKLADGKAIGGVGRLTNIQMDVIQGFYGSAIRRNLGDAKAMSKATMAILDRYSAATKHEKCPTGGQTWCSFQKDKFYKTSNHKPIKNPFTPALVEVMKPVFDRLGNEQFLSGCEKGYTQNANESLHHVIWSMAPKDAYNSPQEISIAIHLGVLQFNSGMEQTLATLLAALDIVLSTHMRASWNSFDEERLYLADYRSSREVKRNRKSKKKKKLKKLDAFVRVEGVTYQSQSFHTEKAKKAKKEKSKLVEKERNNLLIM